MRKLSHLSRVALVIGVQKYDAASCPNLGRVHDDVDAISKMLETQGGFVSVTSCLNPTQRELIKALSKFEGVIKQYDKDGGCVALLYYSGHGMMDKSNHYLLPTDWEELESISASLVHFACQLEGEKGVLSHLAGAKAAVALFDCCRTLAPQEQARGGRAESKGGWHGHVATPGTIGQNLLLCYACPPGACAYEGHDHGNFTEAILKFLCTHRTVCDAISAINRQVFDSTGQMPHAQGFDFGPYYELALGA